MTRFGRRQSSAKSHKSHFLKYTLPIFSLFLHSLGNLPFLILDITLVLGPSLVIAFSHSSSKTSLDTFPRKLSHTQHAQKGIYVCVAWGSRKVGTGTGELVRFDSRAAVDPVVELHVVCISIHQTFPVPFVLERRDTRTTVWKL